MEGGREKEKEGEGKGRRYREGGVREKEKVCGALYNEKS